MYILVLVAVAGFYFNIGG